MKSVDVDSYASKLEDLWRETLDVAQMAKIVQNTEHSWSPEQWREISKAIEKIEEGASQFRFKK